MGRGDGDEDSVSLIDLKSKPYRVVGTFGVPSGPEPLKFSPDGRFLAVGAQNGSTKPSSHPFHHDNGAAGPLRRRWPDAPQSGRGPVGPWAEAAAFSRDGKTVLIQSMQDRTIEVFRWNGKTLTRGKSLSIQGAGPNPSPPRGPEPQAAEDPEHARRLTANRRAC